VGSPVKLAVARSAQNAETRCGSRLREYRHGD